MLRPAVAQRAQHAQQRTVFVTVGTTRFDALSSAADSQELAAALLEAGFTRLVMQVGSGGYRPHRLLPPNSRCGVLRSGLSVEWFDYAPSLTELIGGAALVISHAGSGSIFEALAAGVPLIAVPNDLLMDGHQADLTRKLGELGHLVQGAPTPEGLAVAVAELHGRRLVRYVPGSGAGVASHVDRLVGRS